ncbi:hypothetical protein [Polynucleobacter sp. JS-Polo-80-F4]|uniref:hypothetical protein n=1 Tax=Polynucleobacter sp. JS-Polo-80-F4 TaxID=2576918 RepID=UPI001C0AEDB5|nr:hypothetical protein [Polynucleobacter sp. JS-Polo-80-F4]MBU3617286.1 hypothetical protein [Polynucleobacter sp. JS-Polo-80-F4]
MKKYSLLTALLCLWAGSCYAQLRDYGTARTLTGTVFVYNIFIAEPGNPWKMNEKKSMLKKSELAHKWLIQRAAKLGKPLTFIEESNINSRDVIVAKIPGYGNYSSNIVNDAVKLSGFKSNRQFKKWAQDHVAFDSILVAVYANKSGRSYAEPSSKDIEGFLVYKTFEGSYETASTIAHETLHCFGAIDLYSDPTFSLQYNQNAERANQLWPNDIMHEVPYSFSSVRLGPLSSWLVGIGNHDPAFDRFKPR